MPYYVYKINVGELALIKHLEKLQEFEIFNDAKNFARQIRTELQENDTAQIKVMFALNELEAEEKLQEKRDAPILREWEK